MLYGPSTKMEKVIVKRICQRYPIKAISYKIAFTFTFDGNTLAISSKGNGKTYNQAYKVIINKVNLIKATGENGETLSLEKIK